MNKDSDVDVVAEFERGKVTFRNVCGLVDFLEGLFGRKVDILTPDGIESIRIKHIKGEIKREIEYAKRGDRKFLMDILITCDGIIKYTAYPRL